MKKLINEEKIVKLLRSKSVHTKPTAGFKTELRHLIEEKIGYNESMPPKEYITIYRKYRYVFASILIVAFLSMLFYLQNNPLSNSLQQLSGTSKSKTLVSFVPFKSEGEFKEYLEKSSSQPVPVFPGRGMMFEQRNAVDQAVPEMKSTAPAADLQQGEGTDGRGGGGGIVPDRTSTTNVQVLGIDEPDIVKVKDGNIYFSTWGKVAYQTPPVRPFPVENIVPMEKPAVGIMPPATDVVVDQGYYTAPQTPEVKVIKAYPVSDLKQIADIKNHGNLLVHENMLVVASDNNQAIYGYDISNPSNPQEKWTIKMKENNIISQSRLYNGKAYIVTYSNVNQARPCPYEPYILREKNFIIPCERIYHLPDIVPVENIYTAMVVNPTNGEIEKTTSFVGSYFDFVMYMSQNSIYIGYHTSNNSFGVLFDFYTREASKYLPSNVIEKIQKLSGYSISEQSKMIELETILENYYRTLDQNEVMQTRNNINNLQSDYFKLHMRELNKTKIIKIGLDNFAIKATGEIPGKLLNQFSMDEYNNNLRLATTVESVSWQSQGNANDVYVLDSTLNILGKVTDLGLDERIYSARFIGDTGFVVTFRQTDPFYVIDLRDPRNPQMKGQLKIPGYSSYLHPLETNKILGVGMEGGKVKLSLFDVSRPDDPVESAKYMLDEYYSEAIGNHHAFLHDLKHKVFFIPGGKGGYVFSYDNSQLRLVFTLSSSYSNVQRAVYLNDYLYIIGDNEIAVIDENNWKEVKRLTL